MTAFAELDAQNPQPPHPAAGRTTWRTAP